MLRILKFRLWHPVQSQEAELNAAWDPTAVRFVPFRMGLIWRGSTWPDPGLASKRRSGLLFLVFRLRHFVRRSRVGIRDGAECMAGHLTRTVFNLIFVTPFPSYSDGWTTAGLCVYCNVFYMISWLLGVHKTCINGRSSPVESLLGEACLLGDQYLAKSSTWKSSPRKRGSTRYGRVTLTWERTRQVAQKVAVVSSAI